MALLRDRRPTNREQSKLRALGYAYCDRMQTATPAQAIGMITTLLGSWMICQEGPTPVPTSKDVVVAITTAWIDTILYHAETQL